MSRLGWFGVFVTIIYVVGFGWLFSAQISQIKLLEPNELGDFFAGVFGPMALFWVVLGFFQQGVELRHSVETLKLQAEELKNSVEQQRELVLVSREQIELDRETILQQREQYHREINPVFVVSRNGGHNTGFGRMLRFSILNKGEIASDVSISIISEELHPNEFHFPSIARGASENIEMSISGGDLKVSQFRMFVRCSKKNGDSFEEVYSISSIGGSMIPNTAALEIRKM